MKDANGVDDVETAKNGRDCHECAWESEFLLHSDVYVRLNEVMKVDGLEGASCMFYAKLMWKHFGFDRGVIYH